MNEFLKKYLRMEVGPQSRHDLLESLRNLGDGRCTPPSNLYSIILDGPQGIVTIRGLLVEDGEVVLSLAEFQRILSDYPGSPHSHVL